MKVTVELTDSSTKFIINNIYPLYLHDLSGIWGWHPGRICSGSNPAIHIWQ